MGEPAWIMVASFTGMPTSPAISLPISSMRAFNPSWILKRYAARSGAGVTDHASNAARAAATAASTSAVVPSGMRPITSSVEALMTSMDFVPMGAAQWPLM